MTINLSSNLDSYSSGAMNFFSPSRTLDISSINKKDQIYFIYLTMVSHLKKNHQQMILFLFQI